MAVGNTGVLDGLRRIGAKVRDLTVDGGLPGVPLGYRLRGATQAGAPTSGTWRTGDVVFDRAGSIWTCTAGGSPGTWALGNAANLGAGATLLNYLAPAVVTLTFVGSGTTLVNAALGNSFNLTLTASTTTLGAPSNPVDGQVIRFRVTQGTGGSFTLAYASAYDFGAAGSPTLSTAAAKVDILGFEYVASISKWCYLGSGLGF